MSFIRCHCTFSLRIDQTYYDFSLQLFQVVDAVNDRLLTGETHIDETGTGYTRIHLYLIGVQQSRSGVGYVAWAVLNGDCEISTLCVAVSINNRTIFQRHYCSLITVMLTQVQRTQVACDTTEDAHHHLTHQSTCPLSIQNFTQVWYGVDDHEVRIGQTMRFHDVFLYYCQHIFVEQFSDGVVVFLAVVGSFFQTQRLTAFKEDDTVQPVALPLACDVRRGTHFVTHADDGAPAECVEVFVAFLQLIQEVGEVHCIGADVADAKCVIELADSRSTRHSSLHFYSLVAQAAQWCGVLSLSVVLLSVVVRVNDFYHFKYSLIVIAIIVRFAEIISACNSMECKYAVAYLQGT
ncbi:hypothetical protein SEGD1_021 [Enterobacteria phage SEGD1]|uniref:Uncharacterized protein n=1 Tax=Enterobacteria phage SEGD1 TaxID=1805456 RepID=A0A142II84_9CAUD|nr:hypothetical protein SEGD1_021 [Enterobacteria phage SEGD1]